LQPVRRGYSTWTGWRRPRHPSGRNSQNTLSQHKKAKNIYITYALNITTECDCDGQELEKAADDTGIFASIDPVAIDSACRDIINKKEGRNVFTGEDILPYAEK